MIKLITDGALPHPAKCIVCGFSGQTRNYYWFKYKEKWGQVLICTTCMCEAATLDDSFVPAGVFKEVQQVNFELRAENDRLELATERFTDRFAALVAEFLSDIGGGPEETSNSENPELEANRPGDSAVEPVVEDRTKSDESIFAGLVVDDEPFGKF